MVGWKAPPEQWIKINSDGVAKGNPGPAGAGCVCRTHTGQVIMALTSAIGNTTALMAETWGLLLATRIARQQTWENVWFEADSVSLVQLINSDNKDTPRYLTGMLQEIKKLMTEISQIKVTHDYREANQVADKLANEAIEHQQQHPTSSTTRIWDNKCPSFVTNIVNNDRNG